MKISELFENQTPQPSIAYHITTISNAKEILEYGLEPYNTEDHDWYTEGKRAYLITNTKDIGQVGQWIDAKLRSQGIYDEPMTLLQIDVSGLPLKHDGKFYYSTDVIPPNRIKDLGERTLGRYY